MLEEAEEGIRNIFRHSPREYIPKDLDKKFKKEHTEELANLIYENLIRAIDNYICSNEETIDTNEASKILGIMPDSVLKMIKRGKLIATKKVKMVGCKEIFEFAYYQMNSKIFLGTNQEKY